MWIMKKEFWLKGKYIYKKYLKYPDFSTQAISLCSPFHHIPISRRKTFEKKLFYTVLIIFQELKSHTKFVAILALGKFIASHYAKILTNPSALPSLLYHKLDYNFIKFLMSYGVLFKFLNCYLNQTNSNISLSTNCTIAGAISGISYIYYPKYMIWTFGLMTAIQLFYMDYMKRNKEKTKIHRFFNKIPMGLFLFAILMSQLFHYRIHDPYNAPKLVRKFMSVGTNGL